MFLEALSLLPDRYAPDVQVAAFDVLVEDCVECEALQEVGSLRRLLVVQLSLKRLPAFQVYYKQVSQFIASAVQTSIHH